MKAPKGAFFIVTNESSATLIDMKNLRLILTIVLVISVVVIAEISGLRSQFSIESLKNIFAQYGVWSWLIYILLFTLGNLIQIPGWLFLAASILAIGKLQGFILTLIAAIVSAVVGFFIIRYLGRDAFRKIPYVWVQKILSKIDQYPIRTNIILRLVFQTVPPVNYTLALSGVTFRDYFLGAIIGLPIPIMIYALFIEQITKRLL